MLESWKAVTLPAETQCQVKTVSMFQQQNHSFPVMFAKMSGQSHRHSFRTYIAFYTTFGILVLSICLHRIPETNLLCQINLHFKVNLLIWHSPGYYPWIPGQAFFVGKTTIAWETGSSPSAVLNGQLGGQPNKRLGTVNPVAKPTPHEPCSVIKCFLIIPLLSFASFS